jgi:RNA polymerase sigma factor (sigma-70 family)
MLGNEHDALDAYQECVCQLVRRSDQAPLHCVAGYAFRTAANLALETIRSRRRRAAHWGRVVANACSRHDPSADDPALRCEAFGSRLTTDVREAVRTLPRHLREVIVLRDLGELSYNRVATILDIRPTTARVYRRQAIIRLGQMLSATGTQN